MKASVFSDRINDLFSSQLRDWELARINYGQLANVRIRKISFGTFDVCIQFNPGRIRSSAAKVDARSIEERPCFLCELNRPAEQKGVSYDGGLTILVNPYPIFERHLTIPSELHKDQRIGNNFAMMLSLAEALPSYTIFYNGPQCGASAPDHFHLQAGSRGFMPVESDFISGKHTRLISGREGMEVWLWTGYKRGIITLAGSDKEKLAECFCSLLDKLSVNLPGTAEPMLNILAGYQQSGYVIHIIPRKKHRPSQFFTEGRDKILVSPAAVDLGGVIITPREEDYNRITRADLEDIFAQVCYDEEELSCIINAII